jgi:hypothetical protein
VWCAEIFRFADFIGTMGSFEDDRRSSHTTDLTLRTAYLTTAFCSAIAVIYTLVPAQPTPGVVLFMAFAPTVAVCAWLQKDARLTGFPNVLDWGFFCGLAWPFVIPWYAFKTRGRSGWRLAAMLLGLVFAPTMTVFVVEIVV